MSGEWSSIYLRVMLHPVATYRAHSLSTNLPWRHALRRPLLSMLIVGAFVSLTTTGAFFLPLVADGALFWSFVPVLQAAAILVATIACAPARPAPNVGSLLDGFFAGQGPWLVWLLLVSGLCLLLPPALSQRWIAQSCSLAAGCGLVALVWSNVTTFGFLRGGLGLTRRRATIGLLLYDVIVWGVLVGYLLVVESLQLFRLRP